MTTQILGSAAPSRHMVASEALQSREYRPDVDGLRAVAVIAVVLFHLWPALIPGGFIGVDVFFVISGYLITGLIVEDIWRREFSFRNFYLRRIRRIVPPLACMLLVSGVAAFFILYPEDMRAFANTLGAQPFSVQNIVFLVQGEYFRGAETKPLLHTWSLAVEEQFYLLWPALIYLLRKRVGVLVGGMVAVAVLSFATNIYLLTLSPKASFFLLPSRAWQLGIGGLAAILCLQGFGESERWKALRAPISSLGLVLIASSLFFISSKQAFPGWVALVPTVGAAMVLAFGKGAFVGRFLSMRPLVKIGLLSYAIYLWHWPLIAFAHHLGLRSSGLGFGVAVLLLSAAMSWLSFEFVERPIRSKRMLSSSRALVIAFAVFAVATSVFAAHLYFSKGASYRYAEQAEKFLTASFDSRSDRCGFWFRLKNPKAQVCSLGGRSESQGGVLLWGNSHADMWTGVASQLARESGQPLYLNARNCRATADSAFCSLSVQKQIIDFVRIRKITDVILASTWYGSYGILDDKFEDGLREVVRELTESGVRVWLVIDVPASESFDPFVAYLKNPAAPALAAATLSHGDFLAGQKQKEAVLFERLQAEFSAVRILDPSDILCEGVFVEARKTGFRGTGMRII